MQYSCFFQVLVFLHGPFEVETSDGVGQERRLLTAEDASSGWLEAMVAHQDEEDVEKSAKQVKLTTW